MAAMTGAAAAPLDGTSRHRAAVACGLGRGVARGRGAAAGCDGGVEHHVGARRRRRVQCRTRRRARRWCRRQPAARAHRSVGAEEPVPPRVAVPPAPYSPQSDQLYAHHGRMDRLCPGALAAPGGALYRPAGTSVPKNCRSSAACVLTLYRPNFRNHDWLSRGCGIFRSRRKIAPDRARGWVWTVSEGGAQFPGCMHVSGPARRGRL